MASSQDIVVLLLGETGSGKSSFVNEAAGRTIASVGHGLEACTSKVQAHKVKRKKHNILLVDTPGFNQTEHLDPSIMEQIKIFVDAVDSGTVCFGAVLMFIPLNESHQAGMKKLQTANALILSQLAKDRVAIVTVGGNDVSGRTVEEREVAFKRMFDDPRSLINSRFDFTRDSAGSILDEVLEKGVAELQILKNAIQAAHGCSTPKNSRLGSLLKWLLCR